VEAVLGDRGSGVGHALKLTFLLADQRGTLPEAGPKS
jgi:hypothetical protein